MKRLFFLLAAIPLIALSACAAGAPPQGPAAADKTVTELSLWCFPVGGWSRYSSVSSLLTTFRKDHPEIRIELRMIDYNTGDGEIAEAIANGEAPDLVLEGPERLMANWGARGLMADLSDLWTSVSAQGIQDNVRNACFDAEGKSYIYPVCMTTHCMAINRDLFAEKGALQYVDEANHTWTTQGFLDAVRTLHDNGVEDVAALYCNGQAGDQGTRALVTNLYGGTFTNAEHTAYTVDDPNNIKALEKLKELEAWGVRFEAETAATDEIARFRSGKLAMSLCWNVSMEMNNPNEDTNFDILPLAFPSEDVPSLQGGIWGFGIFDNGSEEKIAAAKTFIRDLCEDDEMYSRAVTLAYYQPVRPMDLYVNEDEMTEYAIFGQYMGDYYQVTPGWTDARTAWWKMLQAVGAGTDAGEAAAEFMRAVSGD